MRVSLPRQPINGVGVGVGVGGAFSLKANVSVQTLTHFCFVNLLFKSLRMEK